MVSAILCSVRPSYDVDPSVVPFRFLSSYLNETKIPSLAVLRVSPNSRKRSIQESLPLTLRCYAAPTVSGHVETKLARYRSCEVRPSQVFYSITG